MTKRFVLAVLFLSGIVMSAARPPMVEGIRPLGMGGAFTAVADDYNVLQYNPAGLAKIKSFQLNIPHIEVETSQKSIDFMQYFIDNSSLFEGDLSTWTTETIDKLTNASLKVNALANLSVVGINTPIGNFGFGGFATVYANVATEYDILNINAVINANIDIVVPFSYGTMLDIPALNQMFDSALLGGRMAVGGTLKYIQRYSLTETRSAFELMDISPDKLIQKLTTPVSGIGFDLGINYYVPNLMNSTFSFVVLDLITSIGTETVNARYNFGYSVKPVQDLTLALDINDILGNVTILNKMHIGAEYNVLGFIGLRVGLYQGWTGFGVSIGRVLEYANYGIETGLYAGQIEERQHRASIALPF
jgi:hypothetical protein